MKLRIFAFFMAVILCFGCISLFGCDNGKTDETTAEETTASAETTGEETTEAETDAPEITDEGYDGSAVTIVFYHTMGQNLRDVLEVYIAEFNKLYPNITIEQDRKSVV